MLMERLPLDFTVHSPSIDETPLPDEDPVDLVLRLAEEKAQAVSARHPDAIVIGSDQLAVFKGRIIGKPGSEQNAVRQLQQFSGQCIRFLTAVAVNCTTNGFCTSSIVTTEVCFRILEDAEIRRYVAADKPLDCTGGFKSEAGGASLLTCMRSEDPAAIIGLPLISLTAMLRDAGFQIP
jgi:septum formation protein